MSQSLNLH